jgi:hypothetical protein
MAQTAIGRRSNSDEPRNHLTGLPHGLWKRIERDIIDERETEIKHNSQLIFLDPWNLSRVFYTLRKRLRDMGYNITDLVKIRPKIHTYVKEYCDSKGIKRHDIGIFTADRALLAYRGELYSVGFDRIIKLAELGTDIICIEKKNIVDRLVRFTDNFGIALVQSQGFMSEYGGMLVEIAKEHGANVAILTDFDDSGVLLGYQLKGVVRFGIDPEAINEINNILLQHGKGNISISLLEEEYKRSTGNSGKIADEKQNHWKVLKDLVDGWYKDKDDKQHYSIKGDSHMENYHNYLNKEIYPSGVDNVDNESYIEYLRTRRIELDSLMTFVPTEVFWIWLRNKILGVFPKRDHNRTVIIPSFVYTPAMNEFTEKLQIYLSKKLESKLMQTRTDLKKENVLIDLNKKEKKIKNEMFSYLLDDIEIMYFDAALRNFTNQHLGET